MSFLRIFFPIMMVVGAVGSLVVNIIGHGGIGTSLQWLGAAILYAGLTLRNTGK